MNNRSKVTEDTLGDNLTDKLHPHAKMLADAKEEEDRLRVTNSMDEEEFSPAVKR